MKNLRQAILLGLVGLVVAANADAKPWWLRGTSSNEDDFLAPDVAFRVASRVDGDRMIVRWVIAGGYYLYRDRMKIMAESPDMTLSMAHFPQGTVKTDPYFGTQEIYTQQVEGSVSFVRSDAGAHPLQIKVTYQGCAEAGLCYPPITKVLFPVAAPRPAPPATNLWAVFGILAGVLAFFLAGITLRQGRRLTVPA